MSENNQVVEKEAEELSQDVVSSPVAEAPAVAAAEAPSEAPSEAPKTALLDRNMLKRKKKRRRRIITLIVVLVVLAGAATGLYMLFREQPVEYMPITEFVYRGSISSTVTGSGVTSPQNSATITLSASGTVQEVFAYEGDFVNEGDPLYIIDSTEAKEAVLEAQKTVDNYVKQINKINESYTDLTVTAPFKGILMDVADISVGDNVGSGTTLAKLVDNTKMKLELYYSYVYESDIYVGQTAQISIPLAMNELVGQVTEINYVQRISPEGSKLFQVTLTVDNPDTLTEGMGASATLKTSSGEEIYPYDGGELKYNRQIDVVTKASGEAQSVNLLNYGAVSSGTVLLRLGAESNEDQIASIENQLKTARETLERAQKNLDNFEAVAPMSGTVLTSSLIVGETAESGKVAITIADTTMMVVNIQIDEMNVSYVKPGMFCDITQWGMEGTNMFFGTVESVSLEGKYENGISYFPAVVKVDNPDGMLMSGMYVDYSLVASQSDDCLVAPLQAIKYTEFGTCVFVRAETMPENAIDPELVAGLEIPEGFYAVPVTTGISDTYYAEIIDGLEEGAEVFTQLQQSDGMNGGMGGGMIMVG